MVLITGGAFQGKKTLAGRLYGLSHSDITDGAECVFDEVFTAAAISDYHELVRRLLAAKIGVSEFTERLCAENPRAVITMNEVGCGVIPLQKSERIYREEVGRAGCVIASHSETVIRVFCGIPEAIKGELP